MSETVVLGDEPGTGLALDLAAVDEAAVAGLVLRRRAVVEALAAALLARRPGLSRRAQAALPTRGALQLAEDSARDTSRYCPKQLLLLIRVSGNGMDRLEKPTDQYSGKLPSSGSRQGPACPNSRTW